MASFLFLANQWLNANGAVYAGAKANVYLTGTTTTSNSYQDSALATPHTNPVVADSAGRFAPIYLNQATSYKVVITDASNNTLQTIDPVKTDLGTANVAIAGLTPAANKFPYFTGAAAAALADITAYGRSLVNAASEAALKALVNLEIGTDVQAWDAYLDDIAATSPATGDILQFNGTDWVSVSLSDQAPVNFPFVAELLSSGTWTAPWNCYVNLWLFGGGGSGGIRGNVAGARASGGGAAGTSIKISYYVPSGTVLTFTRGDGGAGVTGTDSAGNAGGNSTCTDTNGLSMTANGGGAGGRGTSGTIAGGTGGTATGGDRNITGQAGVASNSTGADVVGGIVGLVSTPTAQAANSTTVQHAVTYSVTLASRVGPFTADSPLSNDSSSIGRGCGTKGDADAAAGTRNSATGGNGALVIEYSGVVS